MYCYSWKWLFGKLLSIKQSWLEHVFVVKSVLKGADPQQLFVKASLEGLFLLWPLIPASKLSLFPQNRMAKIISI